MSENKPFSSQVQPSAATLSVAGNTDVTLTAAQYANSQMILTGVLTGNINVIFPDVQALYQVANRTTGAFTLTAKVGAGASATITQGTAALVLTDGFTNARVI